MIQIDIDIPVNCASCPFTRAINTYSFDSMCVLTKKPANEMRHREKWCPLREVARCVECAYIEHDGGALYKCGITDAYVMEDGYCNYGVKREDEDVKV